MSFRVHNVEIIVPRLRKLDSRLLRFRNGVAAILGPCRVSGEREYRNDWTKPAERKVLVFRAATPVDRFFKYQNELRRLCRNLSIACQGRVSLTIDRELTLFVWE